MPASREEIAQKFMELAFRFGYRRTAVEDVARALHISKKTIYEYFPTKQALLQYALELGAQGQRLRVESMLTEKTALGRALEVASIALADARAFFESSPNEEMVEPPELQAQINERVFGPMVHELLVQGVEAGEFEVPDVDMTTRFVLAVGMEGVRLIREDPSNRPEQATRDALRRLITGESRKKARQKRKKG
jgi:AcrR family transcriptional regulator